MTRAQWAFGFLAASVLAANTGATKVGGDVTVLPLIKGTTWTYAGTVKWTDPPNTIRSNDVRWVSEVVDAFDHGDVAAALLSGGVWDVARWERKTRPGDYVFVRVGTRYHLVYRNAKKMFAALKKSGAKALATSPGQEPWFRVPLKEGQVSRPPDMGRRDDVMYGWLVWNTAAVKLDVPGMTSVTRRGYLLSYLTLASEEYMTIVPGIGITSFAYCHNGTVAETHLRLVGFRRGDAH